MSIRFFKPYIPSKYTQGLIGNIKVLVLGASHYCIYNKKSDKFKCSEWENCTSTKIKDSSKFNETCPYYKTIKTPTKLENSTCDEIENYLADYENYLSFNNFTQLMIEFTLLERDEIWERIAFSNYVQYFVPTIETPNQTKSDIKNFIAFLETLNELKPDLVIIWGTKITNHFKKKYIKSMVDKLEVRNDTYFLDMVYNKNRYILINPYHPCDCRKYWSNNLNKFKSVLSDAIKEIAPNSIL